MLLSVHKVARLIGGRPRLDLPWTATPAQQQTVVERCKGMRVRDEVCCLPHGMTAVHFEKAFGVVGQLKSAEYLLLAGPYGKVLDARLLPFRGPSCSLQVLGPAWATLAEKHLA